LPRDAAQFVQLDRGVFRAIARQKLEIFDRQKKFVAIGIMEFEAVVRRARRLDRLQPGEPSDAMIDMDDDIAHCQRTNLGQKVLGAASLAAAAEEPVAQNILLCDEREILRLETLLDADDRQGEGVWRKRESLRERRHRCRAGKPVVGKHMAEPLARAIRPAGEDHPLAACLQGCNMANCSGKDIGGGIGALRRKAAAGF